MSSRVWWQRLGYWLALTVLAGALLLTIALGAVVAVLSTGAGTTWLFTALQTALPELHIDGNRGNLVDGLQLEQLRWDQPDLLLTIDQLELRLHWPNLLRGRVTVEPVHATRLTIVDRGPSTPGPVKLPTLLAPFALYVPQLALDELNIRSGDTVVTLSDLHGQVRWLGPTLQLSAFGVTYRQLQLRAATGWLRFVGDYRLQLAGTVHHPDLDAPATLQARGSLRQMKLTATTNGRQSIAAQALLQLLDDDLPLSLHAQLRRPIERDFGIDTVTLQSTELAIAGNLKLMQGTLRAALHDTRYGDSTLTSPLTWDGSTLSAQPHLQIHDGTGSKGELRSACSLATATPWRWDCTGDIAALSLTPWLNGLTGMVSTPFSVGGEFAATTALHLELPALSGDLNGTALTGKLQLASPDLQRWEITTAQLRAGVNQLVATGVMDGVMDGSSKLAITLDAPILATLYGGLSGSATAKSDITGDLTEATLNGTLSVRNLHFGDWGIESGSSQWQLLKAGRQQSRVSLSLHKLSRASQQVDLSGTLTGTRDRQRLQLQLAHTDGSAELDCNTALTPTDYRVDCTQLQGRFAVSTKKTVAWSQQSPLRLRWNPQTQEGQLAALCLRAEPASLCIKPDIKPGLIWRRQQLQPFSAEINAMPLRWWRRFLPANLRLRNNALADAHLQWISQKPLQLNADLLIAPTDWTWRDSDRTEPVHFDAATAKLHLDTRNAVMSAALHSPTVGAITGHLTVLDPLGAKRLEGGIEISAFELGALGLAPAAVEIQKGRIDGTLGIGGTTALPLLDGEFALADASIDITRLGEPIRDLNARLHFNNQRADLNGQFQLRNGKATLDGRIDWAAGYRNWQATAHLLGSGLQIEPLAGSTVEFNPDLTFSATPGSQKIDGKIDIAQADIRLQQLPPNTISPSADTVVSGRDSTQSVSALSADIDILLGEKAHFVGFGADVDLGGKLHLHQQPDQDLQSTGRIKVTRGRYRAYGQRLVVRKGQFIFTGNLDNPDLSLEAIREFPPGNNDVVGLRVTGTLHDPIAQLFSDQSLTESDIAYYLLTGRKRDASQPAGQLSAGSSLLSLGLAGSEDQAAKLAEKFGIRGLQLGTAGTATGGTEAEVSGYVFKDIYVRYGRRLGEQIDSVTLQYQLSPNLMVQSISSIEETLELIYTFSIN